MRMLCVECTVREVLSEGLRDGLYYYTPLLLRGPVPASVWVLLGTPLKCLLLRQRPGLLQGCPTMSPRRSGRARCHRGHYHTWSLCDDPRPGIPNPFHIVSHMEINICMHTGHHPSPQRFQPLQAERVTSPAHLLPLGTYRTQSSGKLHAER